ncbi:MAG: hypothetical protein M1355_00180 [Patescibacteria group bacterium]|nr:hypothetical protein [Patescibacteria group bacterium]
MKKQKDFRRDFKKAITHERKHLREMGEAYDKIVLNDGLYLSKIFYRDIAKKYKNAKDQREFLQEKIEEEIFEEIT